MFDDSLFKIIGYASIRNRLSVVSENVNVVLSIIIEHDHCCMDASFPGMTIT